MDGQSKVQPGQGFSTTRCDFIYIIHRCQTTYCAIYNRTVGEHSIVKFTYCCRVLLQIVSVMLAGGNC